MCLGHILYAFGRKNPKINSVWEMDNAGANRFYAYDDDGQTVSTCLAIPILNVSSTTQFSLHFYFFIFRFMNAPQIPSRDGNELSLICSTEALL